MIPSTHWSLHRFFLFIRRDKSFRYVSITTACNLYWNPHCRKSRYQSHLQARCQVEKLEVFKEASQEEMWASGCHCSHGGEVEEEKWSQQPVVKGIPVLREGWMRTKPLVGHHTTRWKSAMNVLGDSGPGSGLLTSPEGLPDDKKPGSGIRSSLRERDRK